MQRRSDPAAHLPQAVAATTKLSASPGDQQRGLLAQQCHCSELSGRSKYVVKPLRVALVHLLLLLLLALLEF